MLRSGSAPNVEGATLARFGWRMPLLGIALLLGMAGRIAYSWNAPLWFDETFSGVIATQPDFHSLIDWCLTELTGPAFYMPLWAWAKVAGSSDMALRLPSLTLSIAGPLLILWKGDRDRDLRLWWAVFALLWVPMFGMAGEARPYPQLFALGTVQAMLFVRLLDTPSIARASGWVIVSSLVVLTHYWGVIPCLVQGMAYLFYHRLRALQTWPALAFSLPLLGWAYFHLPMVLGFAVGHGAAYAGLPLSAIFQIPAMLLGISFSGTVVLGAVLASIAIAAWRGGVARLRFDPALVLALCSVASIALALAFAFLRPGFAPRYATPSIPSFLFGLALWARWMMTRDAKPVIVAVAMTISTAAGLVVSIVKDPDTDPRHLFNFERPSAWLAERHPARMVVFWDGPVGALTSSEHLDEVGGFFLRRAAHPITVAVARAAPTQDPNRAVLALAQAPGTAILWTANDVLPDSRTPRIPRYDARFECRDFGGGQLTMTACRRRL